MLLVLRRLLSSTTEKSKFRFYDLIKHSNRYPNHKTLPVSLREKTENDDKKNLDTFDAAEARRKAAEAKIAKVFGGRIKGEDRQSSSRLNVGEPRIIAGVKVPDKPREPDNCCMSGCINCVWEIFNEDVKEWNEQRTKAAANMVKMGGVWPEDFYPPVELLSVENLPPKLAKRAKEETLKKAEEPWSNVPVQIRVFAEVEKRIKAKRKKSASASA